MVCKELSKENRGKEESCSRIKDRNESLALGEDKMWRIWKVYFEDLYYIETQEQVELHMCGFDVVQRGNYFREEPIRRTEIEVSVKKFKNGKAADKDEVTGKNIKYGGDMVIDWIWCLCNMAFENGTMSENWRSAMTVPLYKDKGERTECKMYSVISFLV